MSDTPKTDSAQTGLEQAVERPEDWKSAFEWMCGHARSLERENAELDEMLMRWFKAASPYATPGSLEDGLKKGTVECLCPKCGAKHGGLSEAQ